MTPICPSVTRWTAHDRACKNFCDAFKQIVSALATCVNKRKGPDSVGIFVEITSLKFLATILMLCDVFAGVQLLNVALLKSDESLVLANIPVYLEKTISFLEKFKCANKKPFFIKLNFNKLFDFSKEAMTSLPPSSLIGSFQQLFEWEQFETYVYMPFLVAFMNEVEAVFPQLDFWMVFNILDPRAFPEVLDLLIFI